MNIQNMDEKELNELKKHITQRETEIANEKANKEAEKTKVILDKIIEANLLDSISHSRTSCSDEHPHNGYYPDSKYARCTKCHLMEIIEAHECGLEPDFTIQFTFDIQKIDRR